MTGSVETCTKCAKRVKCTQICPDVEKLLPGVTKGRGRRENLTGFWESTLMVAEQAGGSRPHVRRCWRPRDARNGAAQALMRVVDVIRPQLTAKQYEAAELCWALGLSRRRAAGLLNVTHQAVNYRLQAVARRLLLADCRLGEGK